MQTVLLGVLSDRHKTTVMMLLRRRPQKLRKTIHTVCADRYDGCIYAAKEVLGQKATRVIDRFPVAQWSRKGLDTLRKQALRR